MDLDNLDNIFNEEALEKAAARREEQLQQDEQPIEIDAEECESCKI